MWKKSKSQSISNDECFLPECLTVLSVDNFDRLPMVKNRRFMYCDGTLILGEEDFLSGNGVLCKSHAVEFYESGVNGNFDDFCRGWIGYSKEYPDGIIHFAPMITSSYRPHLDAAIDFLQQFNAFCEHDQTIVRGFIVFTEQKLVELKKCNLI